MSVPYVDFLRAAHFRMSGIVRRAPKQPPLMRLGLVCADQAAIYLGPHAVGERSALLSSAWHARVSPRMRPPVGDNRDAGLDEYAGQAIESCVTKVSDQKNGAQLFHMGHSLGGTLAAIFCALGPRAARGLVLLGAPLSFEQGSSEFRDTLVSLVPSTFSDKEIVPGSLLSQVIAAASRPLWSRWMDAALSLADPSAMDIHARIERWVLDEVPLPGKQVSQIVGCLYREDRFCRGKPLIRGRTVGPSGLQVPLLAIVNTATTSYLWHQLLRLSIKCRTRTRKLLNIRARSASDCSTWRCLLGEAYTQVRPEILSWLEARSRPEAKLSSAASN